MITQRYTFSVSEAAFAFRRRLSVGLSIALLAPMIGFNLYHAVSMRSLGQPIAGVPVLGIVFLAFVLVGWSYYLLWKWKRRKLHVRMHRSRSRKRSGREAAYFSSFSLPVSGPWP